MNFIYLFPNIARAYEIAMLGKFFPTLVPVENGDGFKPDETDLRIIRKAFKPSMQECDDAEFPYPWNFPEMDKIIIEVPTPSADEFIRSLTATSETLVDVLKRVKAARDNGIEVPDDLSSPCKSLLKTAISHLGLGIAAVRDILYVSQLIAKLDGSDKIKSEHIAEAIQYKSALK